MPYQPIYRYALLPEQAYSAYSRPRRDHEDGSYEIHVIKSGNPSYIPADCEVWPIYYNAVMKVLIQHPDVHDDAVAAAREIGQKLKGLENRDIPPGSGRVLTRLASAAGGSLGFGLIFLKHWRNKQRKRGRKRVYGSPVGATHEPTTTGSLALKYPSFGMPILATQLYPKLTRDIAPMKGFPCRFTITFSRGSPPRCAVHFSTSIRVKS